MVFPLYSDDIIFHPLIRDVKMLTARKFVVFQRKFSNFFNAEICTCRNCLVCFVEADAVQLGSLLRFSPGL